MALLHNTLLEADSLSWVMACLIVFVVSTVASYSRRYMAGDRQARRHRVEVLLLGASVLVMVSANHLLLLLAAWGAGNLLLVRLMTHKAEWAAARRSGQLALRTFTLGFAMLAAAFWLMARAAGTPLLHDLLKHPEIQGPAALALLAGAALTISAAWPFHRWLLSSLNSPTPVSALMHAGVVNGGGFLLVRFAPLYFAHPALLHGIFLAGLLTAVPGTLWKLMQTDIKRMLAGSTVGQMGFMLMQCGMGLFAPAVSHLCWHGLFKAWLFLGSPSVALEKARKNPFADTTPARFVLAALIGAAGAWGFARITGAPLALRDTSCLMLLLAFMASTQVACTASAWGLFPAALLGSLTGVLYGLSVHVVEVLLAPLGALAPQPLDGFYGAGLLVLTATWLAMNANLPVRLQDSALWKRLYVASLNASQPHPDTVTATRGAYRLA